MMKRVVGIDVGATQKGFHVVLLEGGRFKPAHFKNMAKLVSWVKMHQPLAIAIDSPCRWARDGGSRNCERSLQINGERISCFSTPTQSRASSSSFYDWVRNGLGLYRLLEATHPIYDGGVVEPPVLCETFPQAVACMLAGRKVSAKSKGRIRRQILSGAGYDATGLRNIDLVDAALCALAAEALLDGRYQKFGQAEDGFIITPQQTPDDKE